MGGSRKSCNKKKHRGSIYRFLKEFFSSQRKEAIEFSRYWSLSKPISTLEKEIKGRIK